MNIKTLLISGCALFLVAGLGACEIDPVASPDLGGNDTLTADLPDVWVDDTATPKPDAGIVAPTPDADTTVEPELPEKDIADASEIDEPELPDLTDIMDTAGPDTAEVAEPELPDMSDATDDMDAAEVAEPELPEEDVPDVCTPDCGDKDCGDDGCGGVCGVCTDGEYCDAGYCEPEPVSLCPPEGPFGNTIGDTLDNVKLYTCDGKEFNTAELCGTKATFVYLFALWCPVCLGHFEDKGTASKPGIEALYADAKAIDGDFEAVVIVTEDSSFLTADAADCAAVQETYGLSMVVLYDPTGAYKKAAGFAGINSSGHVLSEGSVIEDKFSIGGWGGGWDKVTELLEGADK